MSDNRYGANVNGHSSMKSGAPPMQRMDNQHAEPDAVADLKDDMEDPTRF